MEFSVNLDALNIIKLLYSLIVYNGKNRKN